MDSKLRMTLSNLNRENNGTSSIEWTEMTWNPTTGCNKVSSGCKQCYAEVMTRRLQAMGVDKYKDSFSVKIHPDALKYHIPGDLQKWFSLTPRVIFFMLTFVYHLFNRYLML